MLGHLISKGFSQDDEDEDGTREKQRESLLALLEERFLDVSSYTRSKVLQTWKDLITYVAGNGCTRSANSFAHVSLSNKCISSERAVPVKMLNSITRQTVLRLADKIAQVRKRAVLLLTAILEYNPYNNALPLALFEQSLQESETKVRIPTAHRETSSAFDSRLPCCCCCCGTHQLDALTQAQIERLKQSLEKTTGRRQNDAKSAKKGSRKSKRGTAAEVEDQDEQEGELHEQIIVETDDMDQEEADEAQAGEELAAQEDENSDENREIKNYEKRCETLREIVCFIRLFHQAMPGTNNKQKSTATLALFPHDSTFVTLAPLLCVGCLPQCLRNCLAARPPPTCKRPSISLWLRTASRSKLPRTASRRCCRSFGPRIPRSRTPSSTPTSCCSLRRRPTSPRRSRSHDLSLAT